MPKITLRRITKNNVLPVIRLYDTLSPDQKKCVAHNAVSIAQAYAERKNAWPRAVYAGKKLVGFLMVNKDLTDGPAADRPTAYLWRFMIAGPFQGKGYGKAVLDEIVSQMRRIGKKTLYVSCTMDGPMPYAFYLKYGFTDTHVVTDGEEDLRLVL